MSPLTPLVTAPKSQTCHSGTAWCSSNFVVAWRDAFQLLFWGDRL